MKLMHQTRILFFFCEKIKTFSREEEFKEKYGKRAQRVHDRLNEDRFKG